MECIREKTAHKCLGAKGSQASNHDISKKLFTSEIHSRPDEQHHITLCYLIKKGGTKSQVLSNLSKEIWEFLISQGITITVEHVPGKLNVEADIQSRTVSDSSEWKLVLECFGLCVKEGGYLR